MPVSREYNMVYQRMYRKTKQGMLAMKYSQMSKRVRGLDNRGKYYKGLPIIERDVFYQWALHNPIFHKLFANYKESNWQLRLAPVVDRIDSYKGYVFGNIHFVTFSANSSGEKKPFHIKT